MLGAFKLDTIAWCGIERCTEYWNAPVYAVIFKLFDCVLCVGFGRYKGLSGIW